MTRFARLLCLLALLALVFTPVPAGKSAPADDVTLNGSFVWERDDKDIEGDLRAIFTPTGKNQWDVAFHFDWEDGPHVYAGTATGKLGKGKLEGEVENDNDERKSTFRFSGKFKGGTFSGTHGVITKEGDLRDTGKLTLQ